jgi:hypothetical protein
MSVGIMKVLGARYQHAVDGCKVPKCEGKNQPI